MTDKRYPTRMDRAPRFDRLNQTDEIKKALRQHGLESFIERDPNDQTKEKAR